ncbi:FAD-dependent oxidoreductase [Scytonema sp. UIC 10036]|uniref:NAD(P)/FAD-dependent oxidoreductase n=1 Tax=Scytonema sp. UIC 10036 TaxID=2304196 RepID=UPI0012DA29CC|nr:FAD-dependent oxidoreductase [Scytonema sp. UIC 10036]MUH00977.1 FAD-dependent oxidoreductase [Scytonema sp. UIC 10036]
MTDVAVIGAGMAGLVCAQQLSQAGYSVIVVEKSRGLGGRVATRRLFNTCADHGTCYLKPKGELLERFIDLLHQRHILEVWTDTVHELKPHSSVPQPQSPIPNPRYIAPTGISAIAKFLAPGLEILLNKRVTEITPTPEKKWRLAMDTSDEEITATSVVIAIPAPQALMLLEPLGESILGATFLENLRSVEFSPCLSAIAGYSSTLQPPTEWKAVTFVEDKYLAWIGLDSSKRSNPQQPVFVLQSSAAFALHHDQTQDLQPAGEFLLNHAAESLQLSWLKTPEWIQVHRWRYAFPTRPLQTTYLAADTGVPLICCGDWCGGNLVEGAMLSGIAAAEAINNYLRHLPLPKASFLEELNNSI